MRRILDCVYYCTAVLGAAFVVLIGLLICAQVLGRQFGIQVKGADDLTAWSVVAAGFLPLAYTYRRGRHIRVTLIIEKSGAARKVMELIVLLLAAFFVLYLSYSSFDMLRDSIRFKDMSQGLINIPIWIPQLSIPVGAAVLSLAIIDDIIGTMFGKTPSYMADDRQDQLNNMRVD